MRAKLILLKQKILRLLKPPRVLRFTRFGAYFTGLTVGIGLAAMNTGNNLVYLIFGTMLGFITASGVLSEISLRGLEAGWIVPGELFAGKETFLRLALRNGKRAFPSLGIRVDVRISPRGGTEKVFTASCPFLFLPPRSQKHCDVAFAPDRRGEYAVDRIRIQTRFPFGFFVKSLSREDGERFIVYPAIRPVRDADRLPRGREKEQPLPRKGQGGSFWAVRDFYFGDNPRMISWKISAKRARLTLQETEKESEKKILISLRPAALWKTLEGEALESAVSFAASYVHDRFLRGYAVGVLGEDFWTLPSPGKKALRGILAYLALFDPDRPGAFVPPGALPVEARFQPFFNEAVPILELTPLPPSPRPRETHAEPA